MEKFKVIIAGGRDFVDYQLLSTTCIQLFKNGDDIEIVSGCAKGADKLGERFAETMGYPLTKFPADFSAGKSGGPIRNSQMADFANALILFWDGVSRGSADMLSKARLKGLSVRVIKY